MKVAADIDDSTIPTPDESPAPNPPSRKGCGRILLWVLVFIIVENLVIPPRYQLSNNIALTGIWAYQRTASPFFHETGIVRCRFYPSCSEYSRLTFLHYGFLRGVVLSTWRIMRCNPFNNGPHEEWPYEGAWDDCRQLPPDYLNLPPDVHMPPLAPDGRRPQS